MRHAALHHLPTALLLASLAAVSSALQLPDLRPFSAALLPDPLLDLFGAGPADEIPPPLDHQDLLKRQYANTCPHDYNDCAGIGASNLCCGKNSVCSADALGHVACCPKGAACTGTIGGIITAGTMSNGQLVGASTTTAAAADTTGFVLGGAAPTTSSTSNGLVVATTQTVGYNSGNAATGSAFIIDGTSTVASPAAAIRAAQVPALAQIIVRALEYIPV